MRLTKEQKEKENPLLDDRQLRDKCVGRYEVLDKVKELLLLPGTELATVKQVAEFYEVGEEAIVAVYSRHGEIQDQTYHFISEDEFISKINDGFFLEYRKYLSASGLWYYGTAKEDYEKESKMVSILTPDGVNTLISKGINPKVIYIYANQITIKKRLLKRGDNKEEAERRMKADNVDFRGAEMLANRIIYNNEGKELSEVVNEVLKWG